MSPRTLIESERGPSARDAPVEPPQECRLRVSRVKNRIPPRAEAIELRDKLRSDDSGAFCMHHLVRIASRKGRRDLKEPRLDTVDVVNLRG